MFLIYGANGYTGELTARAAAAAGARPVLAGRNAAAVAALAAELGLEHRVFGLDRPDDLARGLEGVRAVLHCAGPFSATYAPMVHGCLRAGAHYLDVTGEVAVFEAIAGRDAEARAAGVTLLPGVGFDVVPTDCLAAYLKARLPSATELVLAFRTRGGTSRGTRLTALERLGGGGLVRKEGRLMGVPAAWKTRRFDFGAGPELAVTIPWGDLATAYRTTGIGDIEVYTVLPASLRRLWHLSRYVGPLFRLGPVRAWLRRRILARPRGPGPARRERGRVHVYGEVRDPDGRRAAAGLEGPHSYVFTARAAVAAARKVLDGLAPTGYVTPALAFGADFALEIDGVRRFDLDV